MILPCLLAVLNLAELSQARMQGDFTPAELSTNCLEVDSSAGVKSPYIMVQLELKTVQQDSRQPIDSSATVKSPCLKFC